LAAAGAFVHLSSGDTFCPTQFGLVLVAPACFTSIIAPSLKLDEVSVNGSAAKAAVPHRASMAADSVIFLIVESSGFGVSSVVNNNVHAKFRAHTASLCA
jgi:hypothetical protein